VLDTIIPKKRIISKSKITNINIIIKKWIENELCNFPTGKNPLSKGDTTLF
jgi:hypothetical protein